MYVLARIPAFFRLLASLACTAKLALVYYDRMYHAVSILDSIMIQYQLYAFGTRVQLNM